MLKNPKYLKHLIYLATLILFILFSVQNSCGSIRAYLNYSFFDSPEGGPYIETYLAIDGTSVKFLPLNDSLYQASINVTMIFRQDSTVVSYDKYNLLSDPVASEKGKNIDVTIIDMQRYFLEEGPYDYEIILVDNNVKDEPFSTVQPILINFDSSKINLSGIQLVDSVHPASSQSILTKSGYDLYPRVFNYYPPGDDLLSLYTEIYNTDVIIGKDEKFLISTQIKSFESDFVVDDFAAFKRADTRPVIPHYHQFNISKLPTGNYILIVEVRNRENELLAMNSLFFQRSNPDQDMKMDEIGALDIVNTFVNDITDEDTLTEHIKSLEPRATHSEKQFIYKGLKQADFEKKQRFFYYFWYRRDKYNPEEAWLNYLEMVKTVNERFSTQVSKGYETDRGRVYLKYGPPNAVAESYNEPSAYPYEIWHYYKLGFNQSNKRFVFYSHDIITNNFELLHSDAIGELNNPRWQLILNSRWYDTYGVDATEAPEIWGGQASDYYRNPR